MAPPSTPGAEDRETGLLGYTFPAGAARVFHAAVDLRVAGPWTAIGPLPPQVRGAVPKRVREYTAGRWCAASALRRAGHGGPFDVGMSEERAPLWPRGFVGSITHSKDFAAAAVGHEDELRGLGIDWEELIAEKTIADIHPIALTEDEHRRYDRGCVPLDFRQLVTLTFSAKESVYKCIRPLVADFFEFHDAEVTEVDTARGAFRFRLLKDLGFGFDCGFEGVGAFLFAGDYVRTLVELARAS